MLSLRNDTSHPGGGFAVLGGPDLAGVTSITIENSFSSQYLGEDGKWGRNPFAFPVEEGPPGTLLLGPHIVDHVPTELQIELRSGDGRPLGKLFWADVIPSRNPGSVTSAQVIEERGRRVAQNAADERERIEAQKARDQAERETGSAEKAAREAASDAAAVAAAEIKRGRVAERERAAALAVSNVPREAAALSRTRRRRWPLAFAFVLLPIIAFAALVAAKPDLLDTLRLTRVVSNNAPVHQQPVAAPAPAPEATPSKKAKVDCSTFAGRVTDLQGHSDAEKVTLGEEALHAGCGTEAFLAFDSSDWQANEAAAWNLARFYDPNEEDPVYRRAASVHPDFAAAYYRPWRDRSPRQAAALAKICQTEHGGGASLRQSCGH